MYKTSSPYIERLLKCGVKWLPYSNETIKYPVREERIIFLHIGSINNIIEREKAAELFSNTLVSSLLNDYFAPVAIDIEEFPEIGQIGFDLLSITENIIALPINIFILPGAEPFSCFSNTNAENFIELAYNAVKSFNNKRALLERAGEYMVRQLERTGTVLEKEQPFEIRDKILHVYVRNWIKKAKEIEKIQKGKVCNLNVRYYIFLLKYAYTYNETRLLNEIRKRIDNLYGSAMFDPLEGGFFSQYTNNDFDSPLFEKQFSDNIMAAILYAMAYEYFGDQKYREISEKTISHLESSFRTAEGVYRTAISLKIHPESSTYYKISLNDLNRIFAAGSDNIAVILGMDLSKPAGALQNIKNSERIKELSTEEKEKLIALRKERETELLLDNRVIMSGNCSYACLLPLIAKKCGYDGNEYIKRAENIIRYIIENLRDGDFKFHRYLLSSCSYGSSTLLDYALLLMALIILFIVTGEKKYDKLMMHYTSYILENYYKPDNGMFLKSVDKNHIISSNREPIIDYIRYSANSIMAGNLLFLYKIKGDRSYMELFKQQLYNVSPQLLGAGPYLAGWALQVLNYLIYKKSTFSGSTEQH